MSVKGYHLFGYSAEEAEALLKVSNPLGFETDASIRPYDSGSNPMFSKYATVGSECDRLTTRVGASKPIWAPLRTAPSGSGCTAIIQSNPLQASFGGGDYEGNVIYLCNLNASPIIYADNHISGADVLENYYTTKWRPYGHYFDDISDTMYFPDLEDWLQFLVTGAFYEEIGSGGGKVFIANRPVTYDLDLIEAFVEDGNAFIQVCQDNSASDPARRFNLPDWFATTNPTQSSISLKNGAEIEVRKDDVRLRPLTNGLRYTLVNLFDWSHDCWTNTNGWAFDDKYYEHNYWNQLPVDPAYTVNTLLAFLKGGVYYPYVIEAIHNASGGVWIGICTSTYGEDNGSLLNLPYWYFPIVFLQYPLGRMGLLGASPEYLTES